MQTKTENYSGKLGLDKVEDLLKLVKAGSLPKCYTDVEDWQYDFWPDLSWDEAGQKLDVKMILKHKDFPIINSFFNSKYKFDFKLMLEANI